MDKFGESSERWCAANAPAMPDPMIITSLLGGRLGVVRCWCRMDEGAVSQNEVVGLGLGRSACPGTWTFWIVILSKVWADPLFVVL